MRFSIASTLALFASAASAASSWGFSDGAVEVVSRSSQGSQTHTFSDKDVTQSEVTLGHGDKLKVSLTTKDGSKAKRPHQAFLTIKEASGLEAPFALTVKESGKGTVEIVSSASSYTHQRGCRNQCTDHN
jgi:oligosaccharyltransferase complex subunit delta (ribophorin II)